MIDTHMYTQSACVCVRVRTCAHRTGMFCLAPEFLHVLAHDRETSQFGAAEINNLCWWQQRCGPTSGEDRGPCHDRPTAATVCSSCLWSWSLYLGTADCGRNEHNCRLHGVKQQNHQAYAAYRIRFHLFLPTSIPWPLMNPNLFKPMIVMTLLNPM